MPSRSKGLAELCRIKITASDWKDGLYIEETWRRATMKITVFHDEQQRYSGPVPEYEAHA